MAAARSAEISVVIRDSYADLFLSSPIRPRSLDDISIRTSYMVEIDQQIQGLTKALVLAGIKTIRSCEGHFVPEGRKDSEWSRAYGQEVYGNKPWIEFYPGAKVGHLEKLVKRFNKKSDVKWSVGRMGSVAIPGLTGVHMVCALSPMLDAESEANMQKQRESAKLLANHIFDASQREAIALLRKLARNTPQR